MSSWQTDLDLYLALCHQGSLLSQHHDRRYYVDGLWITHEDAQKLKAEVRYWDYEASCIYQTIQIKKLI